VPRRPNADVALAAVNKKQNTKLTQFNNFETVVVNCFFEYPVSLDTSNFLFLTASGDTPFAWNLFDGCNSNPAVAPRGTLTRVSPFARMLPKLR
jgi:hypothetical protein